MAMAAYVVSDVTTFTGAAGAAGRAGDGPTTPSKRAMIDSMSVGLVFMRSNGPDRLKGDLMVRRSIGDSLPLILSAKENPLALPQRERGDELSRDHPEIRGLDVVVTSTKDESLVQLVGRADVAAEARRPGAGNLLLQREQLAAQCPFVVHRTQRRAPREAELEPANLGAQGRVRIGAIERRAADLHIRRMIELPEVEQVQQIGRSAAVPEQLRVARAPGHLRGKLVSSQPPKRAIERKPRPGETVLSEEGRDREWILGFGHGMEMPAVELAELLPVLADIESSVAGQPGPAAAGAAGCRPNTRRKLSSLARSCRTCAASESTWRCVGCWLTAGAAKNAAASSSAHNVRLMLSILSCVCETRSLRHVRSGCWCVRRGTAEVLEQGRWAGRRPRRKRPAARARRGPRSQVPRG